MYIFQLTLNQKLMFPKLFRFMISRKISENLFFTVELFSRHNILKLSVYIKPSSVIFLWTEKFFRFLKRNKSQVDALQLIAKFFRSEVFFPHWKSAYQNFLGDGLSEKPEFLGVQIIINVKAFGLKILKIFWVNCSKSLKYCSFNKFLFLKTCLF